MKDLAKNNRSKLGGLICERLAKAPKIPTKPSNSKKLTPAKKAKKANSPITIKPRADLALAVKTSTEKKTPAPATTVPAQTPPSTSGEDGVKKALIRADEVKVLYNRRKQVRIEELRRAAREALEKMEWNVEVEDSHKSVRDLERICGGFQNRMHCIGLSLKN